MTRKAWHTVCTQGNTIIRRDFRLPATRKFPATPPSRPCPSLAATPPTPRICSRIDGTSRSDAGTEAVPASGTGARCDRRGRGAGKPREAQGAALPASLASGSFITPYPCGLTAEWTAKPPICYRDHVRAGAGIILPWVCAGCVTTVAAQRPLSSEKTEEINELIAGKTADLGLEGAPQVITGKNLRIEGSSLLFLK
jgi:hypothetical protein